LSLRAGGTDSDGQRVAADAGRSSTLRDRCWQANPGVPPVNPGVPPSAGITARGESVGARVVTVSTFEPNEHVYRPLRPDAG
jgi:hypothetical protein